MKKVTWLICLTLIAVSLLVQAENRVSESAGGTPHKTSVQASPSAAPQKGLISPAVEARRAKAAYELWHQTGYKTPADALLMEEYFGSADRRRGDPLDTWGGPDAFGYYWVDSNGDSATFAWIELAGDPAAVHLPGSAFTPSLDDGVTQPIAIGFDFPYYGVPQDSLRIGTNGTIQFTTASNVFGNTCTLPATALGAAILPFWDDLHLARNGSVNGDNKVHYKVGAGSFVMEWDSVGFFASGNPGALKFEVILYADGRIKLQYQFLSGNLNSITIAIQQGVGGTFLIYGCNGTGETPVSGRAVWYAVLGNDPLGRCCYGNPQAPSCTDTTASRCGELSGIWSVGQSCAGNPCPVEGPGERCSSAIPIAALPYTNAGTNAGYADNSNEECPYTVTGGLDVCYVYTPATDERVTIDLCGSDYDTKVYVYANGVPPAIACNDDWGVTGCGPNGWASRLECVQLTGGIAYCIVVDAYSAADIGDYVLSVARCNQIFGRCCYGDPLAPSCSVSTQDACVSQLAGSWEIALDCATACPVCDVIPVGIPETPENQDSSNAYSDPNGGCNNDDGTCGGVNTWGSITCGVTYSGKIFYYTGPVCDGGPSEFRDTDWWNLTLTDSASLQITCVTDAPGTDALVVLFQDNCVSYTPWGEALQSAPCVPMGFTSPCLAPGTYTVAVAPIFAYLIPPGGADYNLTVQCIPCGSSCAPVAVCGVPADSEPNNSCAQPDAFHLDCGESIAGGVCGMNPDTTEDYSDVFLFTIPPERVAVLSLRAYNPAVPCDPATASLYTMFFDPGCEPFDGGPLFVLNGGPTTIGFFDPGSQPFDAFILLQAGGASSVSYRLYLDCYTVDEWCDSVSNLAELPRRIPNPSAVTLPDYGRVAAEHGLDMDAIETADKLRQWATDRKIEFERWREREAYLEKVAKAGKEVAR